MPAVCPHHEDHTVCHVPECPQSFSLQLATGEPCNHGNLKQRDVLRVEGVDPLPLPYLPSLALLDLWQELNKGLYHRILFLYTLAVV